MKTVWKLTVALLLLRAANSTSVLRTKDLNETSSLLLSVDEQASEVCDCKNGECLYEDRKSICMCPPGYGKYFETVCKACECGPNYNCNWTLGFYKTKNCFCQPGFREEEQKCVEINEVTQKLLSPELTVPTEEKTSFKTSLHDLWETTREPKCDCGVYGTCHFENGRKKCTCDDLTAELDGKCVECNCGRNWNCTIENGQKKCFCNSLTSEKDGYCVECDCGTEGNCTFKYGQKKCFCNSLTSEKDGYCVECDCGKNAKSCHFDWKGDKACNCTYGYAQLSGVCVECDCGRNAKSCYFNWKRDKVCNCPAGYSQVFGICEECNCGVNAKSCFFKNNGLKICNCDIGHIQTNGYCAECDCGVYGTCHFENGRKKCNCADLTVELDGKCVECDCGVHGTCHFENGRKKCTCADLTAELDGKCVECNCGVNAKSCFFGDNVFKTCNCDIGHIQTNGYCAAICSKDKCIHGECEIVGKGFKCRCNEGFTGQRCEEKVATKTSKQDLWLVLQLSVGFAIFILLSGQFCYLRRILNKLSKK